MYRSLRVNQMLGELSLADVFFANENPDQQDQHAKRIIRYIAFRQGRIDSQTWVGDMDVKKKAPQILGDMILKNTLYAPIDGLGRSPYHKVFTDMALVEGATGLDLTSDKRLQFAVMIYWQAVLRTIEIFKLQYRNHRREAMISRLKARKAQVDVPPLAYENDVGQEALAATPNEPQI